MSEQTENPAGGTRKRRAPARLFIAPGGRSGNGHGYVNRPQRDITSVIADEAKLVEIVRSVTRMCDEPESPGPAILNSYSESVSFHRSQQHAAHVLAARQTRPLLKAEDRLRNAERRTRQTKRRDLNGELLALRGMLAHQARHGVEPKPNSALVQRLERLEAELDGLPLERAA